MLTHYGLVSTLIVNYIFSRLPRIPIQSHVRYKIVYTASIAHWRQGTNELVCYRVR